MQNDRRKGYCLELWFRIPRRTPSFYKEEKGRSFVGPVLTGFLDHGAAVD
jgi:hypothetical protein